MDLGGFRGGFGARLRTASGDGATAQLAVAYGMLGALAAIVAIALGLDPLACEPWLGEGGALGVAASAALGVVLAACTIAGTRRVVRRFRWARALHAVLRPGVRHAGDGAIVVMALASGIGEELFFRGLLTPLLGVALSSLAFGALHQVRGRARWAWAAWATVMGLLFGVTFRLTGSIAGPVLAHVVINVANLRFLRDTDLEPPGARALGGLLRHT